MSQIGSRASLPFQNPTTTYQNSYLMTNPSVSNLNRQNPTHTFYSSPNKYVYVGPTANSYKMTRPTTEKVSKFTGQQIKQGAIVKGASRIEYVPYQKKVIDYETRTYKQMVPKTRKVVEYEQRKIIETVPREVIKQDFYAVEKITQYYKEIIPEKKVEIIPVEKKVKRIQYIPIEKQIVHYPKNEDWQNVKGQSRFVLESQGVAVRPDAEFKPIQSDLIYKYVSSDVNNQNMPLGYVDLGSRRYLSTAPTIAGQNLVQSNVQSVNNPSTLSLGGSPLRQRLNFQQSQVFSNYPGQPSTPTNQFNEENFRNIFETNKNQYRYRNIQDYEPSNNF